MDGENTWAHGHTLEATVLSALQELLQGNLSREEYDYIEKMNYENIMFESLNGIVGGGSYVNPSQLPW